MTHMHGGLNNQRIAVLGLVCMAYLEGARVALPETLVDFTPLPANDRPRSSPTIPFGEVFDEPHLRERLAAYGVLADAPATEVLPSRECFEQGNSFKRRLAFEDVPDGGLVADILVSCRAAEPLRDLSHQAAALLGGKPPLTLQLRIERDWRDYVAGKHTFSDQEKSLVDPRRIFEKIAATPELREDGRILAFCDEDDLVESRADLKSLAAELGFDLIFKSAIERELAMPRSRVKRSAIDFGIGLLADRYVGLTRSTFSNMLCTLKALETRPEHPEHYIYNAPGEGVARRWDRGFGVEPAVALRRPVEAPPQDASSVDAPPESARPIWRQLEIERLRKDITSSHQYRYQENLGLRKEVAQLKEELANAEPRIERLTQDLAARDAEIAALRESIAHISKARDAKIGRLTERFEKARQRQDATIAQLRAELATLTGSRSWRLTAPLRRIATRAGRLRKA